MSGYQQGFSGDGHPEAIFFLESRIDGISVVMRFGIYVVRAYCPLQNVDAVSGHVQIPLMVAKILADAGHDVTLITTKSRPTDVLPHLIPR